MARTKSNQSLRCFVAGKLREYRISKGFSQGELSEKSGVAKITISKIESLSYDLTLDMLYRLAIGLECDTSELLPDMSWYIRHKGKNVKLVVSYEIDE